MAALFGDVRFAPESRHRAAGPQCPLSAMSRQTQKLPDLFATMLGNGEGAMRYLVIIAALCFCGPATAEAVFPSAISDKYSNEKPEQARQRTCLDQYMANKATNGNDGLVWQHKGAGYYSECKKRLQIKKTR
jgi:hypothetical protein